MEINPSAIHSSVVDFCRVRAQRRFVHAVVLDAVLCAFLLMGSSDTLWFTLAIAAVVITRALLLRIDSQITFRGLSSIISPLRRVVANARMVSRSVSQSYDPVTAVSCASFSPVADDSPCLFARSASVWGAPPYNPHISLEDNVRMCAPALTACALNSAAGMGVDAFVIECNGDDLCDSLDSFAATVNRVLRTLCDADPRDSRCMSLSYIDRPGWNFEFAGVPFFVTTFAPCYPNTHARYCEGTSALGTGQKSCFVLLQPEYSFHAKKLPMDDPTTAWDKPRNIRDRIRVNFRERGMPYDIPSTVAYSPAIHIVRPMDASSAEIVRWWEKGSGKDVCPHGAKVAAGQE